MSINPRIRSLVRRKTELARKQIELSEMQKVDTTPGKKEVFLNQEITPEKGKENEPDESIIIVPFSRIITEESRKLAYKRRRDEYKFTAHVGQRKLLLGEIEFLSSAGKDRKIVVYAGAANGTHIVLLATLLFPQYEYHLYDPAQFDDRLIHIKNVHIYNEYFTKETCYKWAKRSDILFISDIRKSPEGNPSEDDKAKIELEKNVADDMYSQMLWTRIINPEWAMLKFRLPYNAGQTKYLDGIAHLQAWTGETSTETRLWVKKNAKIKIYDNQEYESVMFRHNVYTRVQHFDINPISGEDILLFEGLEFDYDSRAEIHILSEYLKLIGSAIDTFTLLDLFEKINEFVKSPLTETHGKYQLIPFGEEKKRLLMELCPMEKKIQICREKYQKNQKKRQKQRK